MAGFDDEIPAGAMDELISVDTEDMLPDVPLSAQTPVMSNGSHDPEVASVRLPPQSVESEQSVLGGLMLDNNAFDQVADVLTPDDFYRREHRVIYEKIQQMCSEGRPADIVTVYGELEAEDKAREIGGLAYLNSLVNSTPAAANIRRYAEIVRDRSILRQLITAGEEIATSALSPEAADVPTLLDQAQARVFAIDEKSNKGKRGFRVLEELAGEVTQEVQQLYQMRNTGLQKGDLIIVAGRPSMGKTSFAMNIAEYAGLTLKMPVAIFSMEMSSVQLCKRLISSVGRIDAQKMRRGRYDDADWQRYAETVSLMSQALFYIDDTGNLSVNELRSRARRLARKTGGLSLIVVDDLQLMRGSSKSSMENRATEISEISRGLKGLAREMEVPIIALSQLNRGVDARADKRPMMSDLRESGAIEQDADIIMFIYRDWVYNKESGDPNLAEIIIGKQRNGPTGVINMRFDGQYTRFDNLAEEGDVPPEYQ